MQLWLEIVLNVFTYGTMIVWVTCGLFIHWTTSRSSSISQEITLTCLISPFHSRARQLVKRTKIKELQ